MYMADPAEAGRAGADRRPVPFGAALSLAVAAGATLLFGFLPGLLDGVTDDAVPVLDARPQP
jgi:hypothetical protein